MKKLWSLWQSKIVRPSFSGPSTVEEGEEEGFVRMLVYLIQNYAYIKGQVAGSITLNLKKLESLYVAEKQSNDSFKTAKFYFQSRWFHY